MELAINISKEDFNKIDLKKAMNGEKVQINCLATLISMHVRDGALSEILDKAEEFDNIKEK